MTPLVTPLISGAARSREADLQQLQLAGLATCKAGGQGPVVGSRVVNTGLPLVVPPKKKIEVQYFHDVKDVFLPHNVVQFPGVPTFISCYIHFWSC